MANRSTTDKRRQSYRAMYGITVKRGVTMGEALKSAGDVTFAVGKWLHDKTISVIGQYDTDVKVIDFAPPRR